MASPEHPPGKREYTFKDFYLEIDQLKKEATGEDEKILHHVYLDDLDEGDMYLYLLLKKEMLRLEAFDSLSSIRGTGLDFDKGYKSPDMKNMIKKRWHDVAVKGSLSQRLFCEYVSHRLDTLWGLNDELPSQDDFEKGPKDF